MDIVGYDILEDGGLRYAWKDARFKKCIESAAFINRSKGKLEDICGYTTSVSSGCILRTQGNQCAFCRTGNVLPFGGLLTYKEIAKQNIFMVLSDIYCEDHPELHNKKREFAYMGQGEPGYSYSQVRMAIELTNTVMRELNQQVYRHIFATCGIPEAVDNYMSDGEYISLINNIYGILGVSHRADNTYGVRCTEINGKKICFLSLDTSWSSNGGEQDIRALKFGRFQAEDIYQQYNKAVEDKNADLVIALAHHPLDWLTGKEQSIAQGELLSVNRLRANIYISGHVHNRDVINWQNNRHSMTTLVSGIGWPEGSDLHSAPHVYSCYTFNLDLNSIDVYVRSSNEANCFKPDFRIYTQENQVKNRKIVMPINITETQPYFELGAVKGRSPKVCYITPQMIKEISGMMQLIMRCQSAMSWKLQSLRYDYIEQIRGDNGTDESENVRELYEYFFGGDHDTVSGKIKLNKERVYESFEIYLQQLCDVLAQLLGTKNEKREIRVHFRYWTAELGDKNLYKPLVIAGEGMKIKEMRDLSWSELLKGSYEAGHCLIASINEKYCQNSFKNNKNKDESKKKWCDFWTAIPKLGKNKGKNTRKDIDKNVYKEYNSVTDEVTVDQPYLTFGITIYDERDRRLLYVLDYLHIDEIISDMIDDFLYYFPVDFEKYAESRRLD